MDKDVSYRKLVLEVYPDIVCRKSKDYNVYSLYTKSKLITLEGSCTAKNSWKQLYNLIFRKSFDPYWRDKMKSTDLALDFYRTTDYYKIHGELGFIDYTLIKHNLHKSDYDFLSLRAKLKELHLKDFPYKLDEYEES